MEQLVSVYRPSTHKDYLCTITETNNPYEAVDQAASSQVSRSSLQSDYVNTQIVDIISIHNPSGMRDAKQINNLTSSINDGHEIMHDSGLPNMKMVVTPDSRLLLFDGHHTALAYLKSGKKTLDEIPHTIISRPIFLPITAAEISYFFPLEHRKEVLEDWLKFTVNWQAAAPHQVEQRAVTTIGELAVALGD